MNLNDFMKREGEQPLDCIVQNGGFCGIFRKIACIGDSLSSGEHESYENEAKGYHDYYDYSWGQFFARDVGCTVYNFSKGGMTAKAYDKFARENGFYDDAYKSQAYIIALGVNDVSRAIEGVTELGELSDIDLTDHAKNRATFTGFYASIIAKYQAIQPKAKFFLMTIPRDGGSSERQALYDKHAELLWGISKMLPNCYVLDFRKYAPLYDEAFKKSFYLGGHMNACGYRLTALMVESYIDYIIRHNPEDFVQVGFIGTPYHNAKRKW
ncbi:MAG: SGNH/GDSL hydrolase family protein [Clostridia bacterium]|nr:SGNH/GDSL hydrolase family protein [Clostridia bacterium]